MRIGFHVSIAGKIYEALERARSLNINTMQIFSRNPRGWKAKKISATDRTVFIKKRKEYKISPLVVHIPYLVNLTSPDDKLQRKSIKAFIEDIKRADLLKAEYFVTHIGSHKGKGRAFGLRRFTKGLNEVLGEFHPRLGILLETTAGSGFGIGDRFEDLRYILNHIKKQRKIGICFDTSHVFASGYDVSTKNGLENTLKIFDRLIGLKKLKIIHLNDSKTSCGSHVDRHYHIGKGRIGLKGLKRIINHPRLSKIPMIMETPKRRDKDDRMNIATVKHLIQKSKCKMQN